MLLCVPFHQIQGGIHRSHKSLALQRQEEGRGKNSRDPSQYLQFLTGIHDPEFKFEDLRPLENPFDEAARDVLFKRLNVEKTR